MISEFLSYKAKENIRYQFDNNGKLIINTNLVNELSKAIKEGKIPLVMTAKDKMVCISEEMPNHPGYNGEIFQNLSELVAVHVTPIPPINGTIKTQESTGLTGQVAFVNPNDGTEHNIQYLVGNDTIHFTLNCVVHNHQYGNNWDSYKYGVLINFSKLNKSKVLDVKSEDTYLDGDAELGTDYFVFCPLGEREKIAKENPMATIIEYYGITLSDAISYMIIFLGHKLEKYGTYGWNKDVDNHFKTNDAKKLEQLAIKEGYPVLKGKFGDALHSETKYMARRMWKREYEALINLLEYNKENNINMEDDVIVPVMLYSGVYNLPGTVPVSLKDFKEIVFPILKKYGYYVDDLLFDGIEEKDNLKIVTYLNPNDRIPRIKFVEWENALRNRIIEIIKSNVKKNYK